MLPIARGSAPVVAFLVFCPAGTAGVLGRPTFPQPISGFIPCADGSPAPGGTPVLYRSVSLVVESYASGPPPLFLNYYLFDDTCQADKAVLGRQP